MFSEESCGHAILILFVGTEPTITAVITHYVFYTSMY